MREGKKLSHGDFAAVAKDQITRAVTQPRRLACQGGSKPASGRQHADALSGAVWPHRMCGAAARHEALYQADGRPKLGRRIRRSGHAGDWAFLQDVSAWHHVEPQRPCPPVLLTTSARDDRVHPGHARKMAAKLMAQGHRACFHELLEGGHSAGTDNAHIASTLRRSSSSCTRRSRWTPRRRRWSAPDQRRNQTVIHALLTLAITEARGRMPAVPGDGDRLRSQGAKLGGQHVVASRGARTGC